VLCIINKQFTLLTLKKSFSVTRSGASFPVDSDPESPSAGMAAALVGAGVESDTPIVHSVGGLVSSCALRIFKIFLSFL